MNWTRRAQEALKRELPYEDLLPAELPDYVTSYVYYFGVATLASFLLLIVSGIILVMFGPQWWHVSAVGHFFNSLHFWTVQIFFFMMVLHLWAQFFMASWRDGRHYTWMVGVLLFLVSIPTALTGYLSQQNFDSQWIAAQGKDAMNALGVGGFFNLFNFGQMYGFHIIVLPLVLTLLIGLHIFLVRLNGVVRPIDEPPPPERRGRRHE